MVQCLFAQAALYQKAKIIAGLYFVASVVLMSALAVVQTFVESEWLTGLSAGLAVAACFAQCYANALMTKWKTAAAEIQQYFDTTLYSFSEYEDLNKWWHKPITKERVIEKVSNYPTTGFRPNDVWYEDYSSKVPCEQIYFCQRENIRWDGDLRRKYRIACNIVLVLAIVLAAVLAFTFNLTVHQMVSVLLWIVPFVGYLVSFNAAMTKDARCVADLNAEADQIDNEERIAYATTWITKEIALQTKIFEHRKNAVLIPTFFYKLCYARQQKKEEAIAETHKRESINNEPTSEREN